METPAFSSTVPFCVLRQVFLFDREADAKAFLQAFDALLFLERDIVRDDSGKFCVAVEKIEDVYDGE